MESKTLIFCLSCSIFTSLVKLPVLLDSNNKLRVTTCWPLLYLLFSSRRQSFDCILQLDLMLLWLLSSHFQRIPLDFLDGEKFQKAVESYVRPFLTKV